jgi:hypothetical protein
MCLTIKSEIRNFYTAGKKASSPGPTSTAP